MTHVKKHLYYVKVDMSFQENLEELIRNPSLMGGLMNFFQKINN